LLSEDRSRNSPSEQDPLLLGSLVLNGFIEWSRYDPGDVTWTPTHNSFHEPTNQAPKKATPTRADYVTT
jgi:hypothetical protein